MKKSFNSSPVEGDTALNNEILEVISLFIQHLDNVDKKEVAGEHEENIGESHLEVV